MDQNKVLARVRLLLERAHHPSTPETETKACEEKANKLMVEYAIEQADLDAVRPAANRAKPETLTVVMCGRGSPFVDQLYALSGALLDFCRVRGVYTGLQYVKYQDVRMTVIGYPADLRYFEMLYTSLLLHMLSNLEPKPDPNKTFDENVYILHEAGVSYRKQVHALFPDIPKWDDATIKRMGGRCKSAYRRWCKKLGEEPRAIAAPITYQRNFAIGYVHRISVRLWEMQMKQPTSTGLVLRSDAIDALHNEMFPKLGKAKRPKQIRWDAGARLAGTTAANAADLGGAKVGDSDRQQLS